MRNSTTSLLILGAVCAPIAVQADDMFISFLDNANSANIAQYDASTGAVLNSTFATVQFDVTGLAFGPDNNLYAASDTLESGGAGIVSFGIDGTTSVPHGTFVDHVADNSLDNPQGMAFSGGNLYVGDITHSTINVYNSAGTRINTLSSPNVNAPKGLTFDRSGTLYIADVSGPDITSYKNGVFTAVNNEATTIFNGTSAVAVGGDGNLYVLDVSVSTPGIYSLSLADGSAQKLVDYSTSPFFATSLTLGPDGKLYVSGQDSESGEGEILSYNKDGSGGTVFIDTGFGTDPGAIVIVPEPSVWALSGLGVVVFALQQRRKAKRA